MIAGGIGVGGARARYGAFLPETWEVLRGVSAPADDGSGGWTPGTPAVVATVAGRLVSETALPRESVQGAEPTSLLNYFVELAWGADVRPTDQLRRGTEVFEVADADGVRTDGLCVVVAVRRKR